MKFMHSSMANFKVGTDYKRTGIGSLLLVSNLASANLRGVTSYQPSHLLSASANLWRKFGLDEEQITLTSEGLGIPTGKPIEIRKALRLPYATRVIQDFLGN